MHPYDHALELMGEEVETLALILRRHDLLSSPQAIHIARAKTHDLYAVHKVDVSAPRADGVTITFKPCGFYHELMVAGWQLANDAEGRVVDSGWLATHEPNVDYVEAGSRVSEAAKANAA